MYILYSAKVDSNTQQQHTLYVPYTKEWEKLEAFRGFCAWTKSQIKNPYILYIHILIYSWLFDSKLEKHHQGLKSPILLISPT